jgi:hypothetical protein
MRVRNRWNHPPQSQRRLFISLDGPTPLRSPTACSRSSENDYDPKPETVQSQILFEAFSTSSTPSTSTPEVDTADLAEWKAWAHQPPNELARMRDFFDEIDDISYYPTSYVVGRALQKICATAAKRPDKLGRVQGWFEGTLQQRIDTWRTESIDHFLVDFEIWPQTNYEPDYLMMGADFDQSIKMFNVASPHDLVFPGTTMLPFRCVWGTDFQVRVKNEWIPVEKWLEEWKEIAKATNYPVEAAFQQYFYFRGVTNLIFHLPHELKWMIYDTLVQELLIVDHPTASMPLGGRHSIPAGLVESWSRDCCSKIGLDYWLGISTGLILFEWELAQDFTEYLLQQHTLEFNDHIQFINFIERTPMRIIYNIQHIRFVWTNLKDASCCGRSRESPNLFDFLASSSSRQLPDWTLSLLAYLPMLKDIEVFIHCNPWKFPRRWSFVCNPRPCRVQYTNFLVESMFPWIVLRGVKVNFMGAIRSSYKRYLQKLLDQSKMLLDNQPSRPRIHITERSRLRIAGALSDWKDCQIHRWRLKEPRTEEEWRAYHMTKIANRVAGDKFRTLSKDLVDGVERLYVHGDEVRFHKRMIPKGYNMLNPAPCSCYPPCAPDWDFDQEDAFFDDDEAGIAKYEEWRVLKEQEIMEANNDN